MTERLWILDNKHIPDMVEHIQRRRQLEHISSSTVALSRIVYDEAHRRLYDMFHAWSRSAVAMAPEDLMRQLSPENRTLCLDAVASAMAASISTEIESTFASPWSTSAMLDRIDVVFNGTPLKIDRVALERRLPPKTSSRFFDDAATTTRVTALLQTHKSLGFFFGSEQAFADVYQADIIARQYLGTYIDVLLSTGRCFVQCVEAARGIRVRQ
ncbi:MAG: hypothetical protein Q8R11_00020 [bacterium]|nr:hypothetical protein [bacterium]